MTTRLEPLKELGEVANVTTPIPVAVATFYSGTLAQGTGPNGTFLLTDVLPGASGISENAALTDAQELINSPAITDLATIYSQMVNVVDSTYGSPPTITIPAGPAAGVYTTYDDALQALYVAADAEIGGIVADNTATNLVAESNTTWTSMATAWARSSSTKTKASIDLSTLPTTAQLPVTAFIAGLDQQGTNTEVGMSAQYLQSVANVSNQYGQAVVGTLRESRNNAALNSIGVGHDNEIPDQPTTEPPQADLGDADYTVAEARAYVQSKLSP